MGEGISFPSEVQRRIEILQRIDRLHEKASGSMLSVLKSRKILPIALGRDVPAELSRTSLNIWQVKNGTSVPFS